MNPSPQLEELLRTAHGDLQFGMVAEAAHHLRQAASLAPDDPRIDLMLASAAAGRDDHAGVLTAIDRAIAKGFEPPPPIRFARIHALYTLGRIDEALAGIDASEAPPGTDLHRNLLGLRAKCLERDGDLDEFEGVLASLAGIEGDSPRLERLQATADRRRGATDQAIERLQRLLERGDVPTPERIGVGFDLGRLLDRAARYDEAFAAARAANELAPTDHDPEADARAVDESLRASSRAWADRPVVSSERSERPVFIVGMPRSGTSLLEQIVASHPDASGVGERQDPFVLRRDLALDLGVDVEAATDAAASSDLDRAAAAYLGMLDVVGAAGDRVTNKALGLDRVVDFLARVFPEARFLWIHRDPRDAVLSAYLHQIQKPWAWRIPHLVAAHEQHRRLREHWLGLLPDRSLEIRYESLVENPEREIDRAITGLGLEPAESCRRFHESSRVVLTPSHDQVRRPMNRAGIGRWENYRHHLGDDFGKLGSVPGD